jgi:uncharacterized protein YggU (UPF0235/DUF167 family)
MFRITVIAKPNKKERKVIKINDNLYEVWTKMPAEENKANKDIIFQLAEYFNVSKSKIFLISGLKSKSKVFLIK